ncbi:hypothetical protein N9T72_01440 [bacterium]|nr:hypothetical protein [bacterium]
MKNLILTLSLILGATSVSAEDKPFKVGDVFFCETVKFVEWDWNGEPQFINYKPLRFKFSIVDQTTIKFASGGPFYSYKMSLEHMVWPYLKAETNYAKLTLHENKFGYVQSLSGAVKFHAATCDRF